MELDRKDKLLLETLQFDSRLSNAELAEKAGMSASACWRRLRAFEDEGIIEGYSATLNSKKAGMGFQAIVQVQLIRHVPEYIQEFLKAIDQRKEIMECYATTGQADYMLRVLCEDIAAYNVFLEDFLFRLSAVQSAQTNVVLREIKREKAIPL